MNPLISIIVPVYQMELSLHQCVDSILSQSYQNIEIILVNDGSSDKSGAICDQYALADNRIIVIHKMNEGLSSARNAGIKASSGEFLAFVDSDDYIDPDMIELLYRNISNYQADISICGFYHVFPKKIKTKYTSGEIIECDEESAQRLILENHLLYDYYWNKLYRKHIFDNFLLPVGKVFEDIFTQYLLISRSNKIVFQDTAKYYYVLTPSSIVRGGFKLNHMDGLEATKARLDYIRIKHPKLVSLAITSHVNRALLLLRHILSADNQYPLEFEKCKKELSDIWEDKNQQLMLSMKKRVMILTLLNYPRVFSILYRQYYKLYDLLRFIIKFIKKEAY